MTPSVAFCIEHHIDKIIHGSIQWRSSFNVGALWGLPSEFEYECTTEWRWCEWIRNVCGTSVGNIYHLYLYHRCTYANDSLQLLISWTDGDSTLPVQKKLSGKTILMPLKVDPNPFSKAIVLHFHNISYTKKFGSKLWVVQKTLCDIRIVKASQSELSTELSAGEYCYNGSRAAAGQTLYIYCSLSCSLLLKN